MNDSLISDIVSILKNSFERGESISLHKLLGTIDAKHHLILNLDELNSAIKLVGGCQVITNEKNTILSSVELIERTDYVTKGDINKAFKIYENLIKRSK